MMRRSFNVASVSLALLCLVIGIAQQPGECAGLVGGVAGQMTGGLGNVVGGMSGAMGNVMGGVSGAMNNMVGGVTGAMNNMVGGVTGAMGNVMGSMSGAMGNVVGGMHGSLSGLGSSSASASASAGGGLVPNIMGGVGGAMDSVMKPVMGTIGSVSGGLMGQGGLASASAGGGLVPNIMGGVGGAMGSVMKPVMGTIGSVSGGLMGQGGLASALTGAASGALGGALGGNSLVGNMRLTSGAMEGIGAGMEAGLSGMGRANFKQAALDDSMMASGHAAAQVGNEMLRNSAAAATAASEVGAQAGLDIAGVASSGAASMMAANVAAANSGLVGGAASQVNGIANQLGRQEIAVEAMKNAQAESALAGSEMAVHGANNAHSASLASNAHRQAKLATARDRVNIAGTIQNSARISDAAIATHDAATKAEDSLLGSELAVDSAATVLDSDAAYIPPVTSSLLRSLPYGRLGIRNIIPKPLTYPSAYLPDVWLNGKPVNYLNAPLRMYPYAFGPHGAYSTINTAAGIYNGQPLMSNNGLILNGMVYDPAYAYMINSNLAGAVGSSVVPILANGQLEAQDEVAMANLLMMQQLDGAGMSTTYQGYGRLNPVPMITGSVSDVILTPTTTIGTTYPIGSALVIEPRDSFFQDYNDNASSRQNMDERQQ